VPAAKENVLKGVDFNEVRERLKEKRNFSLDYLKKALGINNGG
jgi:hypothetical protein